MQSGQYTVLLIKYNHNIMVEIGLYILKELTYKTSVCHTILVHCWHNNVSRHAVFHYYVSDDRKQYATTTASHNKLIIKPSQNRKVLLSDMINIRENTDDCGEQYLCKTTLYLLSILAHAYNIIFDHGVRAPGHVREVIYGLNDTNKCFVSMLNKTVHCLVQQLMTHIWKCIPQLQTKTSV